MKLGVSGISGTVLCSSQHPAGCDNDAKPAPKQCPATAECGSDGTHTHIYQFQESRHALIIANSYKNSNDLKLERTHSDADGMKATLQKLGFDVRVVKDATNKKMTEEKYAFKNRVADAPGISLFYFSGHGVEANQKNYLIPDGINEKEAKQKQMKESSEEFHEFLSQNTFDLDRASDMIKKELKGCINIVIIDACRSPKLFRDAFKGTPASVRKHYNPILAKDPQGIYLAHAAGSGEVAHTESAECKTMSPFTCHLVRHLDSPESAGQDLPRIFGTVRNKVYKDTQQQQTPHVHDGIVNVLASDIYLRPAIATIPCPAMVVLDISERSDLLLKQDQACSAVYMALLASQAVYHGREAHTFLKKQTRTFSRLMEVKPLHANENQDFIEISAGYHGYHLVAFRDTKVGNRDWLSNLDFTTTYDPDFKGRVHSGYHARAHDRQADAAVKSIVNALKDGKTVVVAGHGLGGAVASVVTLRVLVKEQLAAPLREKLICVTFGQPHVADGELAETIRKKFNKHFLTYVNGEDIVPRVFLLQKQALGLLRDGLRHTGVFNNFNKWIMQGVEAASLHMGLPPLLMKNLVGLAKKGLWDYVVEKNASFRPFGTYLLMYDGQVYAYNMVDPHSRKQAHNFLRSVIKTPEDLKNAIYAHRILRYGTYLEQLILENIEKDGDKRTSIHGEL